MFSLGYYLLLRQCKGRGILGSWAAWNNASILPFQCHVCAFCTPPSIKLSIQVMHCLPIAHFFLVVYSHWTPLLGFSQCLNQNCHHQLLHPSQTCSWQFTSDHCSWCFNVCTLDTSKNMPVLSGEKKNHSIKFRARAARPEWNFTEWFRKYKTHLTT